ncbi:MAG: hypothetical protein WCJ57_04375 [Candidatus Falkowbacteria bacterium]
MKTDIKKFWENFYQEHLGITVDFSTLQIPPIPDGKILLIIHKGLTIKKLIRAIKKHFNVCFSDHDLITDEALIHDRTTETTYLVVINNSAESDEDLKNLSISELNEKGVKGITLIELLILKLLFFGKSQALDTECVTLCSGSHLPKGEMPCAFSDSGDFDISLDPGLPSNVLRARAISYCSL